MKSCEGTGGCWEMFGWVGGGLIADCGVGMPFCDFALLELLTFTDGACLVPGDSGVR